MARVIASQHTKKHKKKRPGIHSKCKTSNLKSSKHYKKKYRGQGKQRNLNEKADERMYHSC